MGGGGGGTQTSTTTQTIPPELRPAYAAAGSLATDLLTNMQTDLPGFISDQTVQGVAGPTGLENLAYQTQQGMLTGQGPQALSDAMGMFGSLGNLPSYQIPSLSGITGWGTQPTAGTPAPSSGAAGPGRVMPSTPVPSQMNMATKVMNQEDTGRGGGGVGDPTGSGGYNPTGGGGGSSEGGGLTPGGIDPAGPGGATFNPSTPSSPLSPAYTQANPSAGIPQQAAYGTGGTGTVREIDFDKLASQYPGAGGGGSWSYSSGGGGDVAPVDRIGSVLDTIDFANHPALQSALDTFAKTALPGIENSMIGAGLGRSGAAGNAIATGKAQIALPVMQQLIQGELEQRGQDVTQRGQDVQANIAAMQAAAQAKAMGMNLQQQKYMADLAAQQTLRAQDISLRGQDINALLQQGQMGLESRAQDIGAMQAGAQGLLSGAGLDIDRVNQAISGAMGIGGTYRDMANQAAESEFMAGQRPYERQMDILQPLLGGAMGSGGQRTTTTGGGGK